MTLEKSDPLRGRRRGRDVAAALSGAVDRHLDQARCLRPINELVDVFEPLTAVAFRRVRYHDSQVRDQEVVGQQPPTTASNEGDDLRPPAKASTCPVPNRFSA